ncbi:MAG: hypothetical protein II034_08700 [Muribaculaceae bacterium]|nr:hypothetical protein [Muribaculaceae bacterium]
MNKIAIYTITSALHDKDAIDKASKEFLDSLNIAYTLYGDDFTTYGQSPLNLIYVRTGGAEGIFKTLLPQLRQQSNGTFYLLTSGQSNSLAASIEILSYLEQNGLRGEILHGEPAYIAERVTLLMQVEAARQELNGFRLGVVGQPSDWLIASQVDYSQLQTKGIELIDVPMQELLDDFRDAEDAAGDGFDPSSSSDAIDKSLPDAWRIYHALGRIVVRHRLQGLTLRCFDLLTSVHNTGCMALAQLNSEGIVCSCEGDIPALLSMAIVQALTGVTGFQANPSRIDVTKGEMILAHCTIPFNMVSKYDLLTHFESGIGVGIRGYMPEGPVTIFKASCDLNRYFVAQGELVENLQLPNLCRTQQRIRLENPADAAYFLTHPIGNHHIIVPGHCKKQLDELMRYFKC